jgi:hypothetical protein
MLIVTGVGCLFNLRDLRQRSILHIGEVLRDRSDILRIRRHECLPEFKLRYRTQVHQAFGIVGRYGTAASLRIHVDFPGDAGGLDRR